MVEHPSEKYTTIISLLSTTTLQQTTKAALETERPPEVPPGWHHPLLHAGAPQMPGGLRPPQGTAPGLRPPHTPAPGLRHPQVPAPGLRWPPRPPAPGLLPGQEARQQAGQAVQAGGVTHTARRLGEGTPSTNSQTGLGGKGRDVVEKQPFNLLWPGMRRRADSGASWGAGSGQVGRQSRDKETGTWDI